MARPRRNDPLDTSDHVVAATDPARIAQRVNEFRRRLDFIATSFSITRKHLGDTVEFNRSLARLKRAVKRKAPQHAGQRRLHPELELIVTHHARQHAATRTGRSEGELVQADIDAAASTVAATVKSRRGRPKDAVLRYHVEGMMALIQEMSGKPVRALRTKDHSYDPQFADAVSTIVLQFFKLLDPAISTTTLANFVIEARRKYAGQPMRFRSFFPLYGGSIDHETGKLNAGPGHRLERFEPSVPIYCP